MFRLIKLISFIAFKPLRKKYLKILLVIIIGLFIYSCGGGVKFEWQIDPIIGWGLPYSKRASFLSRKFFFSWFPWHFLKNIHTYPCTHPLNHSSTHLSIHSYTHLYTHPSVHSSDKIGNISLWCEQLLRMNELMRGEVCFSPRFEMGHCLLWPDPVCRSILLKVQFYLFRRI